MTFLGFLPSEMKAVEGLMNTFFKLGRNDFSNLGHI